MRLQEYFGEDIFDKYGFTLYNKIKGRTISKRKRDDNLEDGLRNVASTLGIDMWDLLEYLEALCHLGFAREIDDSHYRVSTKDVENDTGSTETQYDGQRRPVHEAFNANNEIINVGDWVKVNHKGARAIKDGTVFKVVGIDSEAYGGQERIDNGNRVYHRYIPGWYNETTYVYKSMYPRERINIDFVTKATQEEIDDATVLVTPKENELEIGDRISFEGKVELVNSNDKYNTYKFTDNKNGKIYWAFIKATINCTEGAFSAEIIDIQEKYGKQKIRIGKINEAACHTATI